ncbi:PIN domain-containing protein [Telluribacter sp.]|jgi:predicted nucleic acid-binding protein|uniref:type II toxin-antitoxin system VapC family toxin n=1 Tax=Telluribacter sp. TaxID=1978767 RepID=UPI002E163026|nr:PIN domain-containing protein [Telluribacter sp.]
MTISRLFLDTNVVLDLLGERPPFYHTVAQLASLADYGKVTLVVSSLSFATVNYFLTKFEGTEIAREKLRKFRILSEVAAVDESAVDKALLSDFTDFEDAIQYYAALQSACGLIITRNQKDFRKAQLPVMTAEEYLRTLVSS